MTLWNLMRRYRMFSGLGTRKFVKTHQTQSGRLLLASYPTHRATSSQSALLVTLIRSGLLLKWLRELYRMVLVPECSPWVWGCHNCVNFEFLILKGKNKFSESNKLSHRNLDVNDRIYYNEVESCSSALWLTWRFPCPLTPLQHRWLTSTLSSSDRCNPGLCIQCFYTRCHSWMSPSLVLLLKNDVRVNSPEWTQINSSIHT
jgi:hypothetical protein